MKDLPNKPAFNNYHYDKQHIPAFNRSNNAKKHFFIWASSLSDSGLIQTIKRLNL